MPDFTNQRIKDENSFLQWKDHVYLISNWPIWDLAECSLFDGAMLQVKQILPLYENYDYNSGDV